MWSQECQRFPTCEPPAKRRCEGDSYNNRSNPTAEETPAISNAVETVLPTTVDLETFKSAASFDFLPDELVSIILGYLPVDTLLLLQDVNKRFKRIVTVTDYYPNYKSNVEETLSAIRESVQFVNMCRTSAYPNPPVPMRLLSYCHQLTTLQLSIYQLKRCLRTQKVMHLGAVVALPSVTTLGVWGFPTKMFELTPYPTSKQFRIDITTTKNISDVFPSVQNLQLYRGCFDCSDWGGPSEADHAIIAAGKFKGEIIKFDWNGRLIFMELEFYLCYSDILYCMNELCADRARPIKPNPFML